MTEYLTGPIGVFDSGYGGLTVLNALQEHLPQYDYLYIGDNARAPYGTRSFDTVYMYTLEAVKKFFDEGCHLVILACNTASAKALRTIQQNDLPSLAPKKRVLGVIRPSVEAVPQLTRNKQVGIVGTKGTVRSNSYGIEIQKIDPTISVYQEACPMWVPLVEYHELDNPGADYFVAQSLTNLLKKAPDIDTLVLGCTHYPLLIPTIKKFLPKHIRLVAQGNIVAPSLADYLLRHPEIERHCSKNGHVRYLSTETVEIFERRAQFFCNCSLKAEQVIF